MTHESNASFKLKLAAEIGESEYEVLTLIRGKNIAISQERPSVSHLCRAWHLFCVDGIAAAAGGSIAEAERGAGGAMRKEGGEKGGRREEEMVSFRCVTGNSLNRTPYYLWT